MNIRVVAAEHLTIDSGADNESILLTFNQAWQLEQAPEFAKALVEQLEGRIVETIEGADRYCFRLSMANTGYILQFEYYSNACWLEAELTRESGLGQNELELLATRLILLI